MKMVAQLRGLPGAGSTREFKQVPLWFGAVLAGFSTIAFAGCSSKQVGPELIPVHGTISLNGKLLTTGGGVSFRDDSGLYQANGDVRPDGTYTLSLSPGHEGAPVGKYKVVVCISEPREEAARHNRLPVLIINRKYLDAKTTPLSAEVKKDAAPGAYDFSITN
jgi:hypothetical protein